MRVTGQAARAIHGTAQLLPVMCQVVLVKTPFKVGPCVYARRAVRLQENQVAGMRARGVATRMEKMIETQLEQVGRAGIAGNMTDQLAVRSVGAPPHGPDRKRAG